MTNFCGRRGQATLLVLLLGILGLTIGLSSVSRSVQDVKQSNQVTSGTKALAGAEAQLEKIIAETSDLSNPDECVFNASLFTGKYSGTTLLPNGLKPDIKEVDYKICTTKQDYIEINAVTPEDSLSINVSGGGGGSYYVLWQQAKANVMAIALVDNNFGLERYPVNSPGYSGGNAFPPTNCAAPAACTAVKNAYDSCFFFAGKPNDRLLRVRPFITLGNTSTPIAVCSDTSGKFIVVNFIAKGVAADGTTRVVQKSLLPSALAGMFDYAIFTEKDFTVKSAP